MLDEHPPPLTPLSAKLANVASVPEPVLRPTIRTGTPIGPPCPTACFDPKATVRLFVPLAVAEFDRVMEVAPTELTVVPDGIPVPLIVLPTTELGSAPTVPTVEEPDVSVALGTTTFGPRLVRLPQSVICVESVAHHNRYAVLPAPPPPSLLLRLLSAVPE